MTSLLTYDVIIIKNFRWVTSACMLDYSTVVIGDKFGSISVIRLPKDTNEDTQVQFWNPSPVWLGVEKIHYVISDSILGRSKWCQGTLVTWQFKWGVAKSWNCRQFLCWWHDHCHSGLSLSPKSTKNHNFILENNIDTRWKRMYYLCNDVGCCWNTCSIFKFRRFRFFPNTRNAHETRDNIPDRTRSFEF